MGTDIYVKKKLEDMTNSEINNPEITTTASIADIQNTIDCYNEIAKCLDIACKLHIQAVSHHQNGYHEKAAQSILKANGNLILAANLQQENLIHHAQIGSYH